MAQGYTCLVEVHPQVDLSRIVVSSSMRTYTMVFAILACLSLAALSCPPCYSGKDIPYSAADERDDEYEKTEQMSAWQHHSMLIAFMFRVGSGAGPIRPSTDLRSAAATPEGKRMSTSLDSHVGYPAWESPATVLGRA